MRDYTLWQTTLPGVHRRAILSRGLALPLPQRCDCCRGFGDTLTTNAASKEKTRYRVDRHAKVGSNLKECSPSIASALLALSRPLVKHHLASVIKYRGHRGTYADPSLTLWLLVPYEWWFDYAVHC